MPKANTRKLPDDETLASRFEERAEYLSKRELDQWTQFTDQDIQTLQKLKGPGAKLISGPRGCGKSTLLRRAYFDLAEDGSVLCAYVNFARSLALEPLFHTNANAISLFRQWVVAKVVVGLSEAICDRKRLPPGHFSDLVVQSKRLVEALERGDTLEAYTGMAPSQLLGTIEQLVDHLGARRCVLLFDDAAHAFSPEQQREFFEIFRELRSRLVAAKAAVYPGITSYSPHFHVGHEAELIEAWYAPEGSAYLETMQSIAKRRLTPELLSQFDSRTELIDYIALASFGLPRGFLAMLSQMVGVGDESASIKPTRQVADKAIQTYATSVHGIYTALARKLPRYKHFVETGEELQRQAALALRQHNHTKVPKSKAATIGLPEPISEELRRVLAFLEYAGVVRKMGVGSRGQKGTYHRYRLHYAIVISENVLSLGRSFPLALLVESLSNVQSQAMVRSSAETLLGTDYKDRCRIDLAPCQACGAPRLFEEAKYCMNCGSALKDLSVYEQLLRTPIDALPLTDNKIKGLKEHTSVKTVQDILLDEDNQQIRNVPYVGPVWAARIRTAAEEFVSV